MKIEITGELLQQARAAAYQRQQNRRRAGSRDYSNGQPVQLTGLPGVLGEVALHQFFGLELDWTFLATDAGFCLPDVGGLWEVRATLNPRARLYLFEREVSPAKLAAPHAWILVTDQATTCATCKLLGWAMGWEVVHRGIRQQIQRAPSYFLDSDQLRHFGPPGATWRAAQWCANSARTAVERSDEPDRAAA